MRYFVALLVAFFGYGVIIGKLGAALISLGCAFFFHWAGKTMEKNSSPVVTPKSTLDQLDEYCCECCGPKSPDQIWKSRLEI